MRFSSVLITEITKPQVKNAIRMWNSKAKYIFRDLEKREWSVSTIEFCKILAQHFYKDYHVKFYPSLASEHKKSSYKFVIEGELWSDGGIIIFLSDKTPDFLKRMRYARKNFEDRWVDPDRNKFLEELVARLSHELLHRKQWEKASKKHETGVTPYMSLEHYLATPEEIEAYAQDAARNVVHGRTKKESDNIIDLYKGIFGKDNKVFKRFMKKFHQFLEMWE